MSDASQDVEQSEPSEDSSASGGEILTPTESVVGAAAAAAAIDYDALNNAAVENIVNVSGGDIERVNENIANHYAVRMTEATFSYEEMIPFFDKIGKALGK